MTTHQISLGAMNLEAEDPGVLAGFWASVTGATPSPGGASYYLPPAGPDGFAMFFQPTAGLTALRGRADARLEGIREFLRTFRPRGSS